MMRYLLEYSNIFHGSKYEPIKSLKKGKGYFYLQMTIFCLPYLHVKSLPQDFTVYKISLQELTCTFFASVVGISLQRNRDIYDSLSLFSLSLSVFRNFTHPSENKCLRAQHPHPYTNNIHTYTHSVTP